MELHANRAQGGLQDLGDLPVGKTLDLAQDDDASVGFIEIGDGCLQNLPTLVLVDRGFERFKLHHQKRRIWTQNSHNVSWI